MKLLKFYTETCQPCKLMAPIVEVACEKTGISFEDVHAIEDRRGLDFGVTNVPTLVLVEGDQELARRTGLTPLNQLVQWIRDNGV